MNTDRIITERTKKANKKTTLRQTKMQTTDRGHAESNAQAKRKNDNDTHRQTYVDKLKSTKTVGHQLTHKPEQTDTHIHKMRAKTSTRTPKVTPTDSHKHTKTKQMHTHKQTQPVSDDTDDGQQRHRRQKTNRDRQKDRPAHAKRSRMRKGVRSRLLRWET